MLKYRQKKKRLFLYKVIFFGIYLVMFLLVLLFNDMGYLEYKKIEKQNNVLEKKIKSEIELLHQLQKEKNRLEDDLEYIEKIAREEFKMSKKDEKVFTILINPKKENN